jgi:A/G-specific adenine glycosylase
MIDTDRMDRIHHRLLDWYVRESRSLPWRDTRDPYRILVSEFMLQQTQAERVIPKYEEFLQRFPTLQALADAPAGEVIRAWAGLGYNRRALNLHRACREVVERFHGVVPANITGLLSLPGIGPYTAGAVACFAYETDVAFVDTNIRRVLHRVVYGSEHHTDGLTPAEVQTLARDLLPPGRGYMWNQALMELGATVCRARHARCEHCPLQDDCRARPLIQDALKALPRKRIPVSDRFEQSSRYVRGRIIEVLRQAPDHGLPLLSIGRAVRPEFSAADTEWLRGYIQGLVADGLVVTITTAGSIREDSPSYDEESTSHGNVCVRYALPS